MKCDHQKELYARDGTLRGSWILQPTGASSTRIVCRHCGKFYGYVSSKAPKPTQQPEEDDVW